MLTLFSTGGCTGKSLQTAEIERCACRIKSCPSAAALLWDGAVFWQVRSAESMGKPGRKGPARRRKKERHLWRSLRSREMRPTDWNALALQCLEPMSPLEATSLSPLTYFLTKLLEFLTSWKARVSFTVLPQISEFHWNHPLRVFCLRLGSFVRVSINYFWHLPERLLQGTAEWSVNTKALSY